MYNHCQILYQLMRQMRSSKTGNICWRKLGNISIQIKYLEKNFYDKSRDDYEEIKSIDKILNFLEISNFDYEQALPISNDQNFQIHYRRQPNSCLVKNNFCDGLVAWEANMDFQPVFNHCKAVV